VLIFYIVKFIGFSYRAAWTRKTGFILSFLDLRSASDLRRVSEGPARSLALPPIERTELAWSVSMGVGVGAGFGIAEGIMYSSRYYNGLAGPGIYFVRFISCVALHALWSGSSASAFTGDGT